jgi:hypothetical protein
MILDMGLLWAIHAAYAAGKTLYQDKVATGLGDGDCV